MYSSIEVTDQGIKYILPLEAIDLAYLPVFRRSDKDETVPLWTRQSEDKYFEFEVLQTTQETNSESIQKNIPQETEERLNLFTYIKLLTSTTDNRNPPFTLRAVDEETIEIKLKSNQKVYIPINNFHGYYDNGGTTLCRLCRTSTKQREMHKLNEKHMGLVMAPVNDVHCIRQIDHLWSHCIICNDTIQDKEFHLKCSTGHDSRLRDALGTNNIHTKKQPVHSTLTNNVVLSYNANKAKNNAQNYKKDTQKQDTTEKHVNVGTLANINNNIVTNTKFDTPSTSFKSNEINNNSYCYVCDTKIHVNNLQSHLNGKFHKEKALENANQKIIETKKANNKNTLITRNLESPNTSQNVQNNVICCGIKVHKNNLSTHLNGKYHKERQKNLLENTNKTKSETVLRNNSNTSTTINNTEPKTSQNKNVFVCCDRKLPLNNIHNINAHLKSTIHKKNSKQKPDYYHNLPKEITAKIHEFNNKKEKVESVIRLNKPIPIMEFQNSNTKRTETVKEQTKAAKEVDERIRMLVSKERNKNKLNADENCKKNTGNFKEVLPGTSQGYKSSDLVPKPLTTNAEKPIKVTLQQGVNALSNPMNKLGPENSHKILETTENSLSHVQEPNFISQPLQISAGKSNQIRDFVKMPIKTEHKITEGQIIAENSIKNKEIVNKSEKEKEINEKIKNMIAQKQIKLLEAPLLVSKRSVDETDNEHVGNETKHIENEKPLQSEKGKMKSNENPEDLVEPQAKIEKVKTPSNNPKELVASQAKIENVHSTDYPKNLDLLDQSQGKICKDKHSDESPEYLVQPLYETPKVPLEEYKPSNEDPKVLVSPQAIIEKDERPNENTTPKIEKDKVYDETLIAKVTKTLKEKEQGKSQSNEDLEDVVQNTANKKEKAIFDRIRNLIAKARGKKTKAEK